MVHVTTEVNHWNKGLGIWSTLCWNAVVTDMCALAEPLTALRVLQTELEQSDLVSSVTIKDPAGNTRTLELLEEYDFGHLRTPPYRSHRKHVDRNPQHLVLTCLKLPLERRMKC